MTPRRQGALLLGVHGLLVAARPLYLPGGLLLYVLGALLSPSHERRLALALGAVVVVLVHVITHHVNDAEDVATDDRTEHPTAFTGGSRAIQRGLVTAPGLLRSAMVLSALVLLIAIVEVAMGDAVGASLKLAMLLLGYAYSGRPFALGRRGLGELTTAAVMGVLVPVAGSHAASGSVPAPVLAASLSLFAQTFFARMCTSYPDLDADHATGKRTLLVLVGRARVPSAFGAIALGLALCGLAASPILPLPALQALAALLTAASAAAVGLLARSGAAEKKPVLAPLLGVAGYGVGMGALLLGGLLS